MKIMLTLSSARIKSRRKKKQSMSTRKAHYVSILTGIVLEAYGAIKLNWISQANVEDQNMEDQRGHGN